MSLLLLLYVFALPHIFPFPHISIYAPTRDFSFSHDLGIILPQTKDQRAERHAERTVDRLGFRRRIIGQDLNRDVGIAHRNDAGVLHAQDSHIDLSLREATRCIDDRITLEAVGKGSYGRKRETHISGNARDDEVLAPSRLDRIHETLLIPGVDRSAFNARHAG